MNDTACPDHFITLAHRMADAARPIARRYFRAPIAVDAKDDRSPVTIADREIELAIRAMIAAECPDHGVIGEEHGAERADAEYVWVIDPIDGTRAFITGMPVFGTLIALLCDGRPILGVIDQPISSERWSGAQGHPTLFNGAPARTRPCANIASASLVSTSPDMYESPQNGVPFRRLRAAVRNMRFGGDCYAFGLLACGFIDVITEAQLKPYDYCALVPVVEGAGGTITDWDGRPLNLHSDGRVLAAGDPRAHAQALKILHG